LADKIDAEQRASYERYRSWIACSAAALANERAKNLSFQTLSPPSWIFENSEFQAWLSSSTDKFLWLSGTTGFGKSALAAYLTAVLVEKLPSSSVAWFFCKDNMFLREANHIMRGFVNQLAVVNRWQI